MIEILRKNVEREIEILREISIFSKRLETASPAERRMLLEGLNSLRRGMIEANNSIPKLLNQIETPELKKEKKEVVEITPLKEKKATIAKNVMPQIREKSKILEELEISEGILRKIKKKSLREEKVEEFKKARGYLKLANRFFLDSSNKLIKKGYFSSLPSELRKSNLDILFEAYVSMMLLSVFISFFVSIFIAIFFLVFDVNFGWPIIEFYGGSMATRLLEVVFLPLIIPLIVFFALYYYPSAEKNSISARIDEELPFAVIHMSSISGSGIAPTEIFKIIALSKEYPFLRKEIRKILNQINIYGYDLVTALNNVSKSTSNPRLAELFAGLSTTINSGGDLSEFFEKRAESLLLNYKLEKEKSIKIAETSMDIYISVVIAAPMILMLMLVMISVSGIQVGFTPYELTLMTIGGVALINIVFLAYLQTKRTLY